LKRNVSHARALDLLFLSAVVGVAAACTMPEARYVALLMSADSALQLRQDQLRKDFQLDRFPHYDYDEGTGVFVFSDNGVARVIADVQFVGDVSRKDSTFRWAWESPRVSSKLAEAATHARWYGWFHGVPRLRESGWRADYVDGWEMTSLAAWITGADGAYRAPSADSATYTFMLLRNVRRAPQGRRVESYIASPHSN
jgi:hypothetical protein